MKINTSIRLYVIGAMFVTGSLVIIAMSGVAVSYFFSGMDVAMTELIRSQAFEHEVSDNHPVNMQELSIATRWQDLPEDIQSRIDPSEIELGQLSKFIDGVPLISPPKVGYFVLKLEREGETRFASIVLTEARPRHHGERKLPNFFYIIFYALAAIVIFAGILIILAYRVSTPIRSLRDWAKGLNQEQLKQPLPSFTYSELDALAQIIQSSLSSVQDSLDREQRFLGYASHELRTPIAVTRSNAELLGKMIERDIDPSKQQEVLRRIERAALTMTNLTDTLLWLNRQEDKALPQDEVLLGELIEQINGELSYLLVGKEVSVHLAIDATPISLPMGLCRIVISNLIRNAFQHTYSGEVKIEQQQEKLVIINHNLSDDTHNDDLGFGLGLELTERLMKQYGWYYLNHATTNGRRVEVHFSSSSCC
ncbi:HAMP domain-containing sensor histidine kinase [Agarivorans sp. 1_MG-2023]|uniref:sensor histidine kinase n=1 Tax=Agarivorans sp. 1_MG-2023 TaxID=3062634 RepID=UPI0026E1FBDF|nr:HAMP domain-containing sensor histidine kinase [Agarivorans sp. 1_MG-2023]MDO6762822.1 HAMP domain-containing sensor histidine kinase [Agarivorans sp. 1_MG-2023]